MTLLDRAKSGARAVTLAGDWRSGAYGGNRKAHLWVYRGGHRKEAACGARLNHATTGRVTKRALADLCYDCLAYGASGR